MRTSQCVACRDFPCQDVRHACYQVPDVELDPQRTRMVMISEAAARDPADDYYAPGTPLFAHTTLLAFQDAGVKVSTLQELLDLGVYFTSAVKCAKIGYGLKTATIRECARILEQELGLFPNVQVYLLMGDVAIQAVNSIARRTGELAVIPAGATYKIRGQIYSFRGTRALPSYLQAGPSFFIEKSKRKMIAEDIRTAVDLLE